jgi:hypothetical protein
MQGSLFFYYEKRNLILDLDFLKKEIGKKWLGLNISNNEIATRKGSEAFRSPQTARIKTTSII